MCRTDHSEMVAHRSLEAPADPSVEPCVRPLLDREDLDPVEPGCLFVRRIAAVWALLEGAGREGGARYRNPHRADTSVHGPAHDRRTNSDPERVELPLLQGTGRSNRDRTGDPRS